MRRAIAKQSPVRTIGDRRGPAKRLREGRAAPVVRAVPLATSSKAARWLGPSLCVPTPLLLVAKNNGVLP